MKRIWLLTVILLLNLSTNLCRQAYLFDTLVGLVDQYGKKINVSEELADRRLTLKKGLSKLSARSQIIAIMKQENLKLRTDGGQLHIVPGPQTVLPTQLLYKDYVYERADLGMILESIFRTMRANYILHENLRGRQVTMSLKKVTPEQALNIIIRMHNLQIIYESGIYSVRVRKGSAR